jgi:hypothetical protein
LTGCTALWHLLYCCWVDQEGTGRQAHPTLLLVLPLLLLLLLLPLLLRLLPVVAWAPL